MFRILFLMFVGLFSLALANCKKDSGPVYTSTITYDNPEDAKDAAEKLNVFCEDPNDCPEYVGGLIIEETKSEKDRWGGYDRMFHLSVCSQTLIGPDRVLTNRHCLPDGKTFANSTCPEITVVFPKTSTRPYEKIKCRSVVSVSDSFEDEVIAPDWAILEMTSTVDRTPVPIDTSGLLPNHPVTLFPVYYEKKEIDTSRGYGISTVDGKIKRVSCQSKMNSLFANLYNHPQSPRVSLDCNHDMIKGNSGSGMFSDKGEFSGVLNSAIKTDDDGNPIDLDYFGETKIAQQKSGAGSNAHCIDGLNSNPSENCKFGSDGSYTRTIGTYLSIMYGQAASESEKDVYSSLIQSDESIQWENHNSNFFSKIYRQKDYESFSSTFTEPIAEYAVAFDLKSRFPKTPKCISPERTADKNFILIWPMYRVQPSEISISDTALFSTPLKADALALRVSFDGSVNSFSATFPRLKEAHRDAYLGLKAAETSVFFSCYLGGKPSDCEPLRFASESISTYIEISKSEAYLFMNEDFISDNPLATNEIFIPVCE